MCQLALAGRRRAQVVRRRRSTRSRLTLPGTRCCPRTDFVLSSRVESSCLLFLSGALARGLARVPVPEGNFQQGDGQTTAPSHGQKAEKKALAKPPFPTEEVALPRRRPILCARYPTQRGLNNNPVRRSVAYLRSAMNTRKLPLCHCVSSQWNREVNRGRRWRSRIAEALGMV